MNSELRAMIVGAEGRYLTPQETEQLREYATGMSERLLAARRMQAAEGQILERAIGRLGDVRKLFGARGEAMLEMRHMLRRVALANVRADLKHFREAHAEWIAEQLCQLSEPQALVAAFEALREAMAEVLGEADTYAFEPYLHAFIEELRQWTVV